MRRSPSLALLVLLPIACKTLPESDVQSIEVPSNLTASHVEFAILATLAERPPPEDLSPADRIADNAFRAWFGPFYQSVQRPEGRWFLEAREQNRVIAGFQSGRHYVRVAILYNAGIVSFVIEEVRNLRRYEGRVHRAAVFWIQDLELEIRRRLGQLSVSL